MSNLASLLKNRGQTLSDLARKLAVDKGTVSRWNKKKIPTERLEAIEDATGIAKCDLRPDLASMFMPKRTEVSQ